MMDTNDRITELQTEISHLKAELEKAKERERDVENTSTAMLYMLEDVNKSASEIQRSKKEWEATFDAMIDPIFVHDKELKIVRANRAYANASSLSFKEIIGKPYYEVFPKMERPFNICLKAQELKEEEEEEYSCPITNRIFKVRFYPIKDAEGKYLYSIHIMEDVTEAKIAEQRLKEEVKITTHLLMIADAAAHTTDVDRLMEDVVRCSQKLTGSDICLSYLWDNEDNAFHPSQHMGLNHEHIPLFRTEPLKEDINFIRQVVEEKKTIIIQAGVEGKSIFENGGLGVLVKDIQTLLVIPLIGKKGLSGIIIAIYKNRKEFAERDLKIFDGISYQISTALEQARLYKDSIDKAMELSYKIETIQVMHEIDRSILSTLKSQEILEIATIMVGKVVLCDRATVVLVDKERGGFIYTAGFGVKFAPKGLFIPFKDTSAAEIINTGRPEYVANMKELRHILPIEKRFIDEGFLSHMRVPLTVKGEIIGILTVGAKRAHGFTSKDLSTLEKLAYQIGVALENARLITDLEGLFLGTVKSLSSAIDAKSKWTAGHSERVTRYALDIGKGMGLDEKVLKDIEIGGLLHDIGKLGTYEVILDKPGKLTDEEFNLIRQHPVKGAEILSPIKQLKGIIPVVRHHHEFYNGKGYPDGLKGEGIPLMARIMCVADSVDAMGADRPYRKGRPMDEIIAEVKRCSGTQFDPKVSEVFLRVI